MLFFNEVEEHDDVTNDQSDQADDSQKSHKPKGRAHNPERREFPILKKASIVFSAKMEYFCYLRRNPNDAPDGNFNGYDFWLNKPKAANGNFITPEMVKAFLNSTEYRGRFGP